MLNNNKNALPLVYIKNHMETITHLQLFKNNISTTFLTCKVKK